MHSCCGYVVEFLGEACEKFNSFFTSRMFFVLGRGKVSKFSEVYTRFLHNFFHYLNVVFQSVILWFLPIINIVNNNDNKINKLYFNYWRISA